MDQLDEDDIDKEGGEYDTNDLKNLKLCFFFAADHEDRN